jgi:hypothetical protein
MYCANCLRYFTTTETCNNIPASHSNISKNKELKIDSKNIIKCDAYIWCSTKCYKMWCKEEMCCSCKYKRNPSYCDLIINRPSQKIQSSSIKKDNKDNLNCKKISELIESDF